MILIVSLILGHLVLFATIALLASAIGTFLFIPTIIIVGIIFIGMILIGFVFGIIARIEYKNPDIALRKLKGKVDEKTYQMLEQESRK